MEDTIKDRLVKYLEHKNLSHYKFQKEIGATNGYVHNIKNSISSKYIVSINSKYPDLNIDWLLRGEGEMLVENNSQSAVDNSKNEGILIENSKTGDVTQESVGSHSEVNELLRQILALKDEMANIKNKIFKARLCPTHDECIKRLDEIINES